MSKGEAKTLLDAFWSRNWAIEKVASTVRVREVMDGMWLLNPVSGFWHSLRSDKDRFQSTGVFCFDTWVAICRKNGIKAVGQFHDEIIALVKKGDEGKVESLMHEAVQFGNTYADIH
jgi:hypothetical protein